MHTVVIPLKRMKSFAFCRKKNDGLGMDCDKICEDNTTKNTINTLQLLWPKLAKTLGILLKKCPYRASVMCVFVQTNRRTNHASGLWRQTDMAGYGCRLGWSNLTYTTLIPIMKDWEGWISKAEVFYFDICSTKNLIGKVTGWHLNY